MKETLTKLIQQALQGDLAAFEQALQMKAREIIYISVKLMKNQQDGEDAAQEAMLKMYQHLGELKDPLAFHGWMSQIITRTCIDIKRKQTKSEYDYLETRGELNEMRREFLPQEYIEDVDKHRFLMAVIDDLPENYRACLLFYYYEGLSYREIARAMGTTEKVVENDLRRAKRKIKKMLDRKYEGAATYASLQGMVAIPVLTQAFQLEAAGQASPEMVERILAGASAAATAIGVKTATGFGSTVLQAAQVAQSAETGATAVSLTQTATAQTAAGLSTTSKIVIGLVTAATVTGGAAMVNYFPGDGEARDSELSPSGQEQPQIVTLEDMIGQTAADRLRAYTTAAEDPLLWDDFLEELGTTAISFAHDGVEPFVLYQLEKQDKQLLILQRSEGETLEVAFRFTDHDEAVPEELELIRGIQRWQQ